VALFPRTGVIYRDDNLSRLPEFESDSIDLIYLDPPFFSNRQYEVVFGDESEIRSFEDRWKGGIEHYIDWMKKRVQELHRVLNPNGSLYLHCDPTASHYLKVMLDGVFAPANLRNEIIWRRYGAHNDVGQGSKHYGRVHDVLLFYVKGDDPTWHQQFVPLDEAYIQATYRYVDPESNRRFTTTPLTGPGGAAKGNPVYEWNGHTRAWRYSRDKMQRLHDEGKLHYSKTGYVRQKLYLDESRGVPVQDVWSDIGGLSGPHKERLGWPTQKPEALMQRIIAASSKQGDIVLDPFCGCGTTVTVAHKMQRQWIGIDISPTAIDIIDNRLKKIGATVEIVNGISTVEDLRKLKPLEFQNFVIKRVYGEHNPRRPELGIDGFSFLESLPIEVKQQDRVGREIVDKFETAIRRHGSHKGYIIGFSFTRGAYEEAARVQAEGLEIALIETNTLFDAERDIKPRPDATQLEYDLIQAVRLRLATHEPDKKPSLPRVTIETLAASANGEAG